jgi:hypothetical protein
MTPGASSHTPATVAPAVVAALIAAMRQVWPFGGAIDTKSGMFGCPSL